MEGPISFWGHKEQESNLILPEHDDDDDDENQLDAQFFEFIEYHSTRFGRSFRPSLGVQDCAYSITYMSYRLFDCMLAG